MFDRNRVHFMNAYYKETEKPFGYLLVDNKPCTLANKQIVADLFGGCYAYHFGVNNTDGVKPTCVETKLQANTAQHQSPKPRFQGKCLYKPSPGRMSQTTCGKNTPWEHRRSVRFPKDMLS